MTGAFRERNAVLILAFLFFACLSSLFSFLFWKAENPCLLNVAEVIKQRWAEGEGTEGLCLPYRKINFPFF